VTVSFLPQSSACPTACPHALLAAAAGFRAACLNNGRPSLAHWLSPLSPCLTCPSRPRAKGQVLIDWCGLQITSPTSLSVCLICRRLARHWSMPRYAQPCHAPRPSCTLPFFCASTPINRVTFYPSTPIARHFLSPVRLPPLSPFFPPPRLPWIERLTASLTPHVGLEGLTCLRVTVGVTGPAPSWLECRRADAQPLPRFLFW
jgi:hypothetical protein